MFPNSGSAPLLVLEWTVSDGANEITCFVYYVINKVIEVSCGEYGDNVRKLVTAIQNGKYDIQVGKPFPQPEHLNNVNQKDIIKSKIFIKFKYWLSTWEKIVQRVFVSLQAVICLQTLSKSIN